MIVRRRVDGDRSIGFHDILHGDHVRLSLFGGLFSREFIEFRDSLLIEASFVRDFLPDHSEHACVFHEAPMDCEDDSIRGRTSSCEAVDF